MRAFRSRSICVHWPRAAAWEGTPAANASKPLFVLAVPSKRLSKCEHQGPAPWDRGALAATTRQTLPWNKAADRKAQLERLMHARPLPLPLRRLSGATELCAVTS